MAFAGVSRKPRRPGGHKDVEMSPGGSAAPQGGLLPGAGASKWPELFLGKLGKALAWVVTFLRGNIISLEITGIHVK